MSIIEVHDVSRTYRTRVSSLRRKYRQNTAVERVNFQVEPGETFGLLGPNGAGKTTLIKILTTLLLPTTGSAKVLGYDVAHRPLEVRKRVGYVFGGDRGLYERLSAFDNLRYFAELYGIAPREQRSRIENLLEMVDLRDRQRDRVEGFSRGMRQRLHIARGLLHDPPVIFLDEPSIGIDPVGARELRATVSALAEAGKTVLLTTHYMYEADELCDRIAILSSGSIVAEGTPAGLKSQVSGGSILEVSTYGVPDKTVEQLQKLPGVMSVVNEIRDQQHVLLIRTNAASQVTPRVLAVLEGVVIRSVLTREPSLEDAYVELIGKA